MLPLDALKVAQSELTDWQGSGMSVLEVSHRGKAFVECAAETEALFREILGVPDNYRVLFLQGGASGQFDAIPLNLTAPGDRVAFLNTGQCSAQATKAAKAQQNASQAASTTPATTAAANSAASPNQAQ